MLELTIRLIASLAVVLGLLLLLAKLAGRKFRSGPGATVRVLHRQPLTRSSAVSVVGIGSRVLVIGSTDSQVNLITELDPDELDWVPDVELAGVHELSPDAPMLPTHTWLEAAANVSADSTDQMRSLDGQDVRSRPGRRRAATHRAAPVRNRTAGNRTATTGDTGKGGTGNGGTGALAGSLLSVHTWRQAFAAATRRAS